MKVVRVSFLVACFGSGYSDMLPTVWFVEDYLTLIHGMWLVNMIIKSSKT